MSVRDVFSAFVPFARVRAVSVLTAVQACLGASSKSTQVFANDPEITIVKLESVAITGSPMQFPVSEL